ncbi:MAG: lipopolysaccharide biosynthesis protein [Gammaproteobacteria bacterium]|nr:lipopolysaccharide biosynthesis protein [Gammaproteobacteria bacterium]
MASGGAWMVLFKLVERSVGLISTLILVRLLAPKDFGLVAMAMSFIAMAELLTSFGFDIALIQNQGATVRQYHTAWTCNVLFGLLIFLLMLGAAAPAANFYAEPALFWVLCWLALGPLIGGCENIGVVAFRKELRFRSEFAFQISRKLAGFAVTVPLAFWLRSYWALVAGMLASRLAGTVISYFAHPFRPRFSLAGAGSLFSFSKWLLLNNGLGFLKIRLTDFFIGRLHGATTLGLYNVAYEVANLPTSDLGAPINRALLPGFSRIAQDAAPLRSAYTNAIGALALFALPAAAGIFAVAEFLVPVVLGPKWLAAVPLIQILGIFGAIELFHSSMCAVLIAKGHPAAVAKAQVIFVLLLVTLLIVLVERFGASGAAGAMVGASILSTPAFLIAMRVHTGIEPAAFVRAITRPLVASAAMVAALLAVMPSYVPSMPTSEAAWLLIGSVILGTFLYALAMVLLWLASGRPQSAERFIFEHISAAFFSRLL